MNKEERFDHKLKSFVAALLNIYKNETLKYDVTPLEMKEDELTEDFTAMIYAQWGFYKQITGDDIDILGFTHFLNRLVMQQILSDYGVSID